MQQETCAAISTAHGKAGIAVIRMTGEDAIGIASKVFRCASGKSLCEIPANRFVFGTVYTSDGRMLDTGMAVCFKAPHSYTGEDTVEISVHGSPVGTSMLLSALFAAGARQALPGEFTRRAFVNGKLDLTQAEAVGSLLDAESADELRLSVSQLDGTLGTHIRGLSERITSMLAAVYATIDYPDEDMSDMTDEELTDGIRSVKSDLALLGGTYSSGLAITAGLRCAIVGRPNTGKSTFFNRLLGRERAIVTDIPGTTRDVITESVVIGGKKLLIADTAGLRETNDTVEKLGVERSGEELKDAALIFALFDVSSPLTDEDAALAGTLYGLREQKQIVIVLNKTDKAADEAIGQAKAYFAEHGFDHILAVCADNAGCRAAVEEKINELYPTDNDAIERGMILINARQFAAVTKAEEALERAETAMKTLTRDMAGLDLEEALGALEEADGRSVSEEIVSAIFSKFCVGK